MNKEELLVATIQFLIELLKNFLLETKSYLYFTTIVIFCVVIALIVFILFTQDEHKEKIGFEILKMLQSLIKFFIKRLDG